VSILVSQTTSTPKTSNTHNKKKKVVVIPEICPRPFDVLCPHSLKGDKNTQRGEEEGECKTGFSKCDGEPPSIGDPIRDVQFVVTPQFKDAQVRINLVSSRDGTSVTTIDFPPNVLKSGWNVTITSVATRSPSTPDKNKSGCSSKNKRRKKILSPPFEFDIFDEDGDPVKTFDRSFRISSLTSNSGEKNNVCYGYNHNDNQREDVDPKSQGWNCNDNIDVRSTRSEEALEVSSEFDHLTTFAVLLGSSSNSDDNGCVDDGWDWISITSLALIAGCCSLTLLCVVTYYRSSRFRAMVGGFEASLKMSRIQSKLNKKTMAERTVTS